MTSLPWAFSAVSQQQRQVNDNTSCGSRREVNNQQHKPFPATQCWFPPPSVCFLLALPCHIFLPACRLRLLPMNIMYVRRKTNTAAAVPANNNDNDEPHASSSLMRRLKRSSSKRGSSSLTQDSNNPKQKTGTTSSTLQSLHTELQVLADGAGDSSVSSPPPQQTGGIQRLLKGKKLVRVKRVPARNVSADTLEGVSSTDTGGKKVLRVKVKRKKKEETDTAESPPPRRGGSSRRGRSDASVGTGIVSRAKSWFTFGGMKVGSGGKDFLGVED